MYKIVIIDDEKQACDLLAEYINCGDFQFKVTKCYTDGFQAIQNLEDDMPDVIITDIKMPTMNGIEVAKNVYEMMPGCKVVIISGYGEFEYAKKALEYNVLSYILKPVDMEELVKTLNKIKDTLDMEIENKTKLDNMIMMHQENFFADLVKGAFKDHQEIWKNFKILNFPFELDCTEGILLGIEIKGYLDFINEKWLHGKEKLMIAMRNVLIKQLDNQFIYIRIHKEEKMEFIILNKQQNEKWDLKSIEDVINNIFSIEATASILYEFDSLSSLSQILNDLKNEDDLISLLVKNIQSNEVQEAESVMSILIKKKLGSDVSDSQLAKKIIQAFSKCGIDEDKLCNIVIDANSNASKIVNQLRDIVSLNETNVEDFIIVKVKNFINENYFKDITRDDVAEYVYLNSTYFSRYFKQQTGVKFSDYLLNVRMNKAMELLAKNVKIYEVGRLIGYKNNRHFLRTFKEYTGLTPTEYRRNELKTEGNLDYVD